MSKEALIIKNWPFPRGEKAKLTWISEPYKNNNKWMLMAYFKGENATRRIQLDWASLHFLVPDKYYTNGNLNNGQDIEGTEIIDINLKNIRAEYKERPWEVWGTGFNFKTKSKTFNFYDKGILYSVPIIEVIRAVLVPSDFLLNRILEMDSFENYFIYEIIGRKLEIHFSSGYESKLLKDDKINHLAWLLTNSNVLKMFNQIGQSLFQTKELKFDFLLNNFNIKARIERKNYIRILEILSLKGKRINVEEIDIYHPNLEETQTKDEAKKRRYIYRRIKSNMKLTSEADGSTEKHEEIDTSLVSHEYEQLPKINKNKTSRKIIRKLEDENTKTYILEDNGLRTTVDFGGENLIKGLEFTNIANVEVKGELEEFVEILKLLEKRRDIRSVDIIIGELPEGSKGKRFSKLSDGVTSRKYAIGRIVKADGSECCLIDIEREDKALSMLLLRTKVKADWKKINSSLLICLVENNGSWYNEMMKKLVRNGVEIYRIKHIKKDLYRKEEFIYEKLI